MIDLSTATDAEILTWIRANLGQPRDRRVYCGDQATELRVMRMAIAETARRCDCEMRDDAILKYGKLPIAVVWKGNRVP